RSLEAFRRRGLAVQGFKIGPDFIDPGFHEVVTGRGSYNLDGWMCGREHVLATGARHAADVDLAIVEGVMGSFDALAATSDEASTAQVAKWLGTPVVLVIDVQAQARSAAAVVLGFETFDPALKLAAVIANRVGGDAHARGIREAIAARCGARVVGALAYEAEVTLTERHLGLVTAGEGGLTDDKRTRLADLIERSVDLNGLLELAVPVRAPRQNVTVEGPRAARARIGVAHDAAFCFYYRDNLPSLERPAPSSCRGRPPRIAPCRSSTACTWEAATRSSTRRPSQRTRRSGIRCRCLPPRGARSMPSVAG